MALITGTHRGKPIYRVRWNYRRVDGRATYDERRFTNKREAVEFSRSVTAGHSAATELITVADLHAEWTAAHPHWAKRTQNDRATQYRLRIGPHLGHRKVSKLTPRVVADWLARLEVDGRGGRSANKALSDLKACIRWGRSLGLCANVMVDDARGVQTPPPKPANPYTTDEVRQIAAGCVHLRDATMIYLAAYSGLRWSEVRGLKWSDIDWSPNDVTILLSRSVDVDRSMKSPKSRKARRVPVLGPGVDALQRWREVAPTTSSGLVFPNRNDRPIGPKEWWESSVRIREACKIDFDFHELRDTYASILIQSTEIGEAELTLWLGHRSIQTTLDRYGDLFARRKTRLARQASLAIARGEL